MNKNAELEEIITYIYSKYLQKTDFDYLKKQKNYKLYEFLIKTNKYNNYIDSSDLRIIYLLVFFPFFKKEKIHTKSYSLFLDIYTVVKIPVILFSFLFFSVLIFLMEEMGLFNKLVFNNKKYNDYLNLILNELLEDIDKEQLSKDIKLIEKINELKTQKIVWLNENNKKFIYKKFAISLI